MLLRCRHFVDDGYRLPYLGYDYLALRTYVARGLISGLGRRIGVGKEADIYEAVNEAGEMMVLKIHRSDNRASTAYTHAAIFLSPLEQTSE
jgi:RIO-like serine/threonine protein kinase